MDRRTTRAACLRAHPHAAASCRGLNALALSLLLACALPPLAVHAQEAPLSISIAAQSLSSALVQIANHYSLELAYAPDVVAGLNAPAVSGSLTADQALQRVLAGTGIDFKRSGRNVALTRSGQSAIGQMPLVTVVGDAVDATIQRVNPPSTIASVVPLTQREIPQSVSVLTQQQLQDQQIVTLDDAMRRAPGVFTQKDDSVRAEYFSRGFPIDNIQISGTPTAATLAQNNQNLTGYERVEVLRGPAGLLNSIGGPGGAINLVRKRPTAEPMLTAGLSAGSYGDYRQDIDASRALNADGTLRGRIAGSLLNQDTPRKGAHRSDGSVYGVLEYDLTPSTLLRTGINYDRQSVKDQYDGYPTYGDGSFLDDPKRLYLGAAWNRQVYTTTNYFADVEQKLGGGWLGKLSLNHLEYDFTGKMASPSGPVDRDSDTLLMRQVYGKGNDKQDTVDAHVSGPFRLFGRQHQLTVGGSYLHEKFYQSNQYLQDLFGYVTVDIHDIGIPKPDFNGPLLQRTTTTELTSLYASTRLSLADPLTLVLGGRMTWWRSEFKPDPDANFFNFAHTDDSIDGHFTPYAGLIYDIDKQYSVYGSYTRIFQPQSQRDGGGNLLKPLSGNQYEVGVKGEYLDGRLNAGLALFQLTQKNRATLDPNDPLGSTYFAQGKARARGVELTLSGEVQPGWDILAGYTYTNTKYLDSSENTASAFSAIAPRHMFKLWTNYKLPGELSKWSLGGGAYVTSSFYNDYESSGGPRITQGGYTTVDGRIAYRIMPHTEIALNVFNIFNRDYYERIGGTDGGNWLGAPRTVMLTLRASY